MTLHLTPPPHDDPIATLSQQLNLALQRLDEVGQAIARLDPDNALVLLTAIAAPVLQQLDSYQRLRLIGMLIDSAEALDA